MPAYSGSLVYNLSVTIPQCYPGDVISVACIADFSPTSNNFTMSMDEGLLNIDISPALNGAFPYATSSIDYGNFVNTIVFPNQIVLNSSVSAFTGPYYTQVSSFLSGSTPNEYLVTSSLYNNYGDISYTFDPQPNDRVYISSVDGRYQVLTIQYVTYSTGGQMRLYMSTNIDPWFVLNYSKVATFLVAKRLPDETNVILRFKKPPGATSYGFLIPDDIDPKVLERIGVIQSNVQQQLLSTQQNSG